MMKICNTTRNPSANYTEFVTWPGGLGYLYAAGTWGGGTLTLTASDGGGNASSVQVSPGSTTTMSANGWASFSLPEGAVIELALTGSTTPALSVALYL